MSLKTSFFYFIMKKEAGRETVATHGKGGMCNECEFWEKDPIPYNGIYFGICKLDGKIKCEFHICEFREMMA